MEQTTAPAEVERPAADTPAAGPPAPDYVDITINRAALKVSDLLFLERVRRGQLAALAGQSTPEDTPSDQECWDFFDRVIVGGMGLVGSLPLDALPEVWGAVRAAVFGRRPKDPNSGRTSRPTSGPEVRNP